MRKSWMFILVGLLCLAGCRSKVPFGLNWDRVEETRSSINEIIVEPERRANMQGVLDSYTAQAGKIMEEVKTIRKQIVEKNRDYDTTRAELQALYDQLNAQLDQLMIVARDQSLELKTFCSKAEWEQIFDHAEDLVNLTY